MITDANIKLRSLLIVLLSYLSYVIQTNAQSIAVTLSVTTINANSIYNVSINDNSLQSQNGNIIIGFPSTLYSLSSLSCYNQYNSSQSFSCTVNSGNLVLITYVRGTFASSFLSISISTVKNPSSQQSLNFTYVFTTLTSAAPSTYTIINPLTPDSLLNCSVSFSPSTVYTQSTATFALTTKNALDINGSITITFPSTWTNSVSSAFQPLMSPTSSCTKISGTQLYSTLSCNVLTLFQYISVQSAFATAVPSSSSFSFSATNIYTPPTSYPSNVVTISTSMANGNLVDSSSCLVSPVSAQTISPITSNTFIVGNPGLLAISWQTSSPLNVNDTITLTLPVNYMSYYDYIGTAITYQSGKIVQRSISTNSTQQVIYKITSLSDPYIPSGSQMQITNIVVYCLIDTSTRNIAISITRDGYNIQNGNIAITPSNNILSNVTIGADIKFISTPFTLQISFNTNNSLAMNSSIRIQIPSAIKYITNSTPICTLVSPTSPSSILSNISCTYSANTSLVTIPSFLQSSLPSNSLLYITVSSIFTNPQTSEPTSAFIISTYSSSNNLVDQSINATYSATPATIANIHVTPNSYKVGDIVDYVIMYNFTRNIKSGSVVAVTLPQQIQLSTSPSFYYNINNTVYLMTSPNIITGSTTTLQFNAVITNNYAANTVLYIKISKLVNPTSFKTTSSFQISTTYNNYAIEKLTTGLTITMNDMATFNQIISMVISPMNGATKDYTFYIKPTIPIYVNDTLQISLIDTTNNTNALSFSSNISSCVVQYNSITYTNPCTATANILTIKMSTSLTDTSGSSQYKLIVSSVILARTMKPTSNMKLTSYTEQGYDVQQLTVSSVTNTLPNYLQSLKLNILSLPSQLNTLEQLQFSVTALNGVNFMNGEYITIQLPTSFSYIGNANSTLCVNNIYSCTLYNNNNNIIKVAASVNYTISGIVYSFTIALNNLYVSPTSYNFASDYIYVISYTNNNLRIDVTDPISVANSKAVFFITCSANSHCKTCLDSNSSYCLSCYKLGDGYFTNISYGGYNTMNSNNVCVDICGDGFYNNSGVCQACVSPCLYCTSATVCTSCASTYFYISTNPTTNRCVSNCPTSTYPDTSTWTCLPCSTSCLTCSSTSTTCTSCANSTYLSSAAQCVSQCPSGTYANVTLKKCVNCDLSCLNGCGVNATDCVGCKSGYYKLSANSSECVNSCPTGTVNNSASGLCECSSSCLTCSGSLTYCTTCISPLFLYQHACISTCPAQTYLVTSPSSTCLSCVDTHCTTCNSSSCLLCSNSYYLYAGTCITVCPSGTRLSNYECVLCPNGCKHCLTDSSCTECFTGFLIQANSCVATCGIGYINFNATSCVSQCPTGYYNNSNKCEINTNNNTNNTNNTDNTANSTATTVSTSKIIPFPYTIAYFIILFIAVGIKFLSPSTLLPSALMSLHSILQILSIITLIIVSFISLQTINAGIAILIICVLFIYVGNFINFIFIVKVLNNDSKFIKIYRKTVCANIAIRMLNIITYFKIHEIVFSNIFNIRAFTNKVENVKKLYPFNILLIISVFISVFVVIGASIISYNVQQFSLTSSTFIQSIDCIIVVVLSIIPTVLVLRRKPDDYQKDINEGDVKRYQTSDQLNFNAESAIDQFFIDEDGGAMAANGRNRKNFFFNKNGQKIINGEDNEFNTPLDKKKLGAANPMSKTAIQDGQNSSQALCFGERQKNQSKNKILQTKNQQDIEQIVLQQPVRDQLINSKLSPKEKGNPMLNYTGYDLNPNLLKLQESSQQFKKLPSEMKAKIRLAKANLQIKKNSQNLKKQANIGDLQQIQLSPKKGSQNKLLESGELEKSRSKSKQKREKQKLDEQAKLKKNKSQQIKSKQKQGIKVSRSQNLKKKKKKQNNDIKIMFNDGIDKNNKQQNSQDEGMEGLEGVDEYEQDQPTLPVFKLRNKDKDNLTKSDENKNSNQNDGLDDIEEIELQKQRGHVTSLGKNKSRYQNSDNLSENLNLDDNINNLRNIKGKRTIPGQQPDQLPQMHSSEQLNNMLLKNKMKSKQKTGKNLEFENDDSSIYKKIYNDDAETLKSLQNDNNMLGNEISPSQFNAQNQRFDETDAENDNQMMRPTTIEILDEDVHDKDGFDDTVEGNIKRYSSNHNIDYDSVISKKLENERIKELEKIYLPRLEIVKPNKKKK